MPSLKDATTPRDTSNLVPIAPATLKAPPPVNQSADPEFSSLSLAPIPPILGTSTDASRQFYRQSVSQVRMPVLPTQSLIAVGAQAKSIAEQVVAAAGTIFLNMPTIFEVAGSPASLGSGFNVTLAPELNNTVFAGPPTAPATVSLDGSGQVGSNGSSSAVSTGSQLLSQAGDIGFFGVSQGPNTRTWTPTTPWSQDDEQSSGSPTNSFFYSMSATNLLATTYAGTGSFNANTPWNAVAAFFKSTGTAPSIVSHVGGSTGSSSTMSSLEITITGVSEGDLIVCIAYNNNAAAADITDSQLNLYETAGASTAATGQETIGIYYTIATATGTLVVTISNYVGGHLANTNIAGEVYDVMAPGGSSISAIPTFRRLVLADLPSAVTSPNFSAIGAGTNTNALVVGSGGSLSTTGSGTIAATSVPFSGIASGTNGAAAMTVGSGATLGASGSGVINATQINGVSITGTPTSGQVPTASSGTAAVWATPSSGGTIGGTISSPCLVGASGADTLSNIPGSVADFTNGLISLAPTGTGVPLALTGDAHSSNIFNAFVNGGGSPVVYLDASGNLNLRTAGLYDSTGSLGTNTYVLSSTGSQIKWVAAGGSGVTSLNSLTGVLSITAGSNITVTPSGSSIEISATGGSGSAVGTNVWDNRYPPNTNTSGFKNFSIAWLLPASFLKNTCNSFRFGFSFCDGTASVSIGQMLVVQCTAGTTTVISTTAVTIGGNASPTLTGTNSFQQFTDTIALAVSNSYDYYFMLYFNNSGTVNMPDSATASSADTEAMAYASVDASGNQLTTWATTIPVAIATSSTIYGDPIAVVVS